jgi:hypothetical protein
VNNGFLASHPATLMLPAAWSQPPRVGTRKQAPVNGLPQANARGAQGAGTKSWRFIPPQPASQASPGLC